MLNEVEEPLPLICSAKFEGSVAPERLVQRGMSFPSWHPTLSLNYIALLDMFKWKETAFKTVNLSMNWQDNKTLVTITFYILKISMFFIFHSQERASKREDMITNKVETMFTSYRWLQSHEIWSCFCFSMRKISNSYSQTWNPFFCLSK